MVCNHGDDDGDDSMNAVVILSDVPASKLAAPTVDQVGTSTKDGFGSIGSTSNDGQEGTGF
jgi:hypothetical protein